MIKLDKIRKTFPNWPSELEVAKQSSNWASMAQSFYCASIILNDERENAQRLMNSETVNQINEDIVMRIQVEAPAIFCLAFSLELAIKAVLIKQGAITDLETGQKLPFSSHLINDLAKQIAGLDFLPNEEQCLELAASIIANGKYPVGKAPCELKNGVKLYPNYKDFRKMAEPLYIRLMNLA